MRLETVVRADGVNKTVSSPDPTGTPRSRSLRSGSLRRPSDGLCPPYRPVSGTTAPYNSSRPYRPRLKRHPSHTVDPFL